MTFVVVSSVGIKRVDCIKLQTQTKKTCNRGYAMEQSVGELLGLVFIKAGRGMVILTDRRANRIQFHKA